MHAEVEADDEAVEGEDPREFVLLREDGSADPYYTVGTFAVDRGDAETLFVASIVITEVSSQLLIAVPAEVWHRTRSKRLIPPDCLSKPVLLDVSAVAEDQRDEVTGDDFVRVWVGLLKPEFEACLHFGDQDVHHPFLTRDGSGGFVPFSEGLVALADDKFTFLSAESGAPVAEPVDPTAKRLSAVEEAIVSMKTSLQQLVQKEGLKEGVSKPVLSQKGVQKEKAGPRAWFGRVGSSGGSICFSSWYRHVPFGAVPEVDTCPETSIAGCSGACQSSQEEVGCSRRKRGRGGTRVDPRCRSHPRPVGSCFVSPCEAHSDRISSSFQQEEVTFSGRSFRRFFGSRGGVFIQQHLFQQSPACPDDPCPSCSFERVARGVVQNSGESNALRFWVSRSRSRPRISSSHLPRVARTPVEDPKHPLDCQDVLGHLWSPRLVEARSFFGSSGQIGPVVGANGPVGGGSWSMGAGGGGVPRGPPAVQFFFKTFSSRLSRTATYQVMASSLGRSNDVSCSRTRRLRGETLSSRKEGRELPVAESGGREEGRWKEGWEERKGGEGPRRGSHFQSVSHDPLQEVREELPADVHGGRNSSSIKLPFLFHPKSWWLSSFRVTSASGGSFARFLRSFFRKPATSLNSESTVVTWPMPLPYPGAMKGSASSDSLQLSFHRAINMCVATLNWLHLRRPSCCPLEVVLHTPPNRIQWKVVRQIASTMTAWKEFEPVSVEHLGRAAGKVESFEEALGRLQQFGTNPVSFNNLKSLSPTLVDLPCQDLHVESFHLDSNLLVLVRL